MDSLAFLERAGRTRVHPLYVLHGDEDFLKRQVLQALRSLVLGPEADDFGVSTHPGDKATFAAVLDELESAPFFSKRRLVVVEAADPFVTRYRPTLEKAVGNMPSSGVLVLEVKTWPETTKLAKMIDASATIQCKAPPAYKLPAWCVQWAAARHGKQLSAAAGNLLVELIGPEMGQLDQELEKLAVYVGQRERIEAEDVDRLVGSSRAEDAWRIFDAIGAARVPEALKILDRLLDQGDDPLRILGAFSMQLRKLAQVARLCQQGEPLGTALKTAGVWPSQQKGFEQQLRHLGRRRLDRLYDWLLQINMGLRGGSQLPARALLERLVINLARRGDRAAAERAEKQGTATHEPGR